MAVPKIIELRQAASEAEMDAARVLFEEYAASLNYSLCFQNFSNELASLPGEYAPPSGCLLLAYASGQLAGCIALRSLEPGVCEMKRLYVRPEFRGMGLGRMLVEAIVSEAREKAYTFMRLDSLPEQERAQGLYKAFGFTYIDAYTRNPVEGARFMELHLNSAQG